MVKTSSLLAQAKMRPFTFTFDSTEVIILISLLALVVLLLFAIWLLHRIETIRQVADRRHTVGQAGYSKYIQQLDSRQLGRLITIIRNRNKKHTTPVTDTLRKTLLVFVLSAPTLASWAQPTDSGEG